jgi:leucyl/phenylalanyl-tRNA---protein transferase
MPVYRLRADLAFPPPSLAEPSGLLAVGGDLSSERLRLAYSLGIFPWYEKPPILWFSPDPRMLLAPGRLHVSQRLRRRLRQGRFELRLDSAFARVIRSCAEVPRTGASGTWINPAMIDAYQALHEEGYAHSAEAWQGGELVGGVYGVSLGAAFFAESMFHLATDASKAALVALVGQLEAWGFELFDCQLPTPHLASLGATPWPRERFLAALAHALRAPTRRGRWTLDPESLRARLA